MSVELHTDPGQLADTADERPELIQAVLNVLRDRAEKANEEEERRALRAHLDKY